jgi:hypothetical protein
MALKPLVFQASEHNRVVVRTQSVNGHVNQDVDKVCLDTTEI